MFPGNPGKSLFPKSWSSDKIMHAVSDVATHPSNKWIQIKGMNDNFYTKSGKPSRFQVQGEYEGVKIKVIVEPAGKGIITAYPIE